MSNRPQPTKVGEQDRRIQATPTCALCSRELSEQQDSSEHVIPNAIGGRLKVRGFICTDCNSDKGAKWDSVLAQQLNPLCVLLGVERERGNVPDQPITQASGRELLLQADGMMKLRHPHVDTPDIPDEPVSGETIDVRVLARSPEEAKRITKELEAHYAQQGARLENVTIEDSCTYDVDPTTFQMSIGGEGASHSIVKTALAFAHHCGIPPDDCEQAHKTFAGEIEPCFGYYCQPEDAIVRDRPAPYHHLVLRGCPESRLLLCYVEFFGVYRMIVCLSRDYAGADMTRTYGIDPTSGETVELCMAFDFGSISIEDLYGYELLDTDLLTDAMARLAPIIMKRSRDLAHERALKQAIEYALQRTKADLAEDYEEGTLDAKYVIEKMWPFYEHLIRLQRAGSPSTENSNS